MYFNANNSDSQKIAQLMLGGISPRPIAWVSSQDKNGILNLAPFSFFIAVSFNPPVIAFSQITPRNKPAKDTINNLEQYPECVVNIASQEIIEKMNQTSGEYESDVSEFEMANLTPIASKNISVPGVKESKLRFECRVREIIRFNNLPGSGVMPLLDIVGIEVSDELFENDAIDFNKLNVIGRMHGDYYSSPCHKITLPKPVI